MQKVPKELSSLIGNPGGFTIGAYSRNGLNPFKFDIKILEAKHFVLSKLPKRSKRQKNFSLNKAGNLPEKGENHIDTRRNKSQRELHLLLTLRVSCWNSWEGGDENRCCFQTCRLVLWGHLTRC